ncbi:MAG: AAA family ATPase, partial [Bacteroidales bacterium]|nr:AAA family ATPase [Bacteroidales bacterium]
EFLFNDENLITRIDMSEYQERHTVSRLVGAPPGYVGYDEGGQLTEAVRRKPYSVVLLDEIEKAHPDVFNVLLQVLDDGRLTDNKGRTVDFKNTILIMTSNLKEEELKAAMRPEFLNRIDEIVVFDQLTKDDIREIVHIQMDLLQKKLEDDNVQLSYTPAFEDYMVEEGYSPEYGARPVKRLIQRELVNKLASEILQGSIRKDSKITADAKDGKVILSNG